MTLDEVATAALPQSLAVMGAFHTAAEDDPGDGTLILLGPREPGFWPNFQASPEARDGDRNPMDRWSYRVITHIADAIGGRAFFPFGTPHQPFLRWALRSGRAWSSPVHLLVHDTAGLMVSYRGAILVPQRLELPPLSQSPCDTCEAKPCIQACPASALTPAAYDLAACHAWLDSTEGQSCLEQGCAVRRSCPISATYGRMEAQSAFHMGYFHS